jgi:hypothetical protein
MKYCYDCLARHTAGLHACNYRYEALYVFTAQLWDTICLSVDCSGAVSYGGMSLFVSRLGNPIPYFVLVSLHDFGGL